MGGTSSVHVVVRIWSKNLKRRDNLGER